MVTDPTCAAPEDGAESGEAAEQARDGDRVGETQCLAEEAKWEKWVRRQTDRQTDSALKTRCTWCCICHQT